LTKWWILRGEPMITRLLDVDNISRGVEAARAAGYDWLFLDGPPGDLDIIENCVVKADAVVIPVRTGFFDIDAVTPVVEMCRQSKKPYTFLLSAVDSKMPRLTELAMAGLAGEGPIFATRIRYLQPYILSVSKGKSAAEIDRGCQSEIDSLWAEVKRFAGEAQQPQLTAVIGGKA
jgi:chromosome partitioning protein